MRAFSLWLSAGFCLALAACTSPAKKVEKKEDLLSASGFRILTADTPARHALLTKMPQHKFIERSKDGKPVFLYSDSSLCDCLYIGDDKAYGRYKETITQMQMARDEHADQTQLRDESHRDYVQTLETIAADEQAWDWGVWGPWGPY